MTTDERIEALCVAIKRNTETVTALVTLVASNDKRIRELSSRIDATTDRIGGRVASLRSQMNKRFRDLEERFDRLERRETDCRRARTKP